MATAPHDGRTPRTRPASPSCLPHLPRSPQHRRPPGIAPLFSHRARSPAAQAPTGHCPALFPPGPLPRSTGGPSGRAQSAVPHHLPILLKKARWGRMGARGEGGPPVRQPRIPSSPEASHVCPPVRTCESSNGFLYLHVGRATAWHAAMSRGPGPKTPVTARERAFLPCSGRSHARGETLSTRLSGPVFHYLTAPAEQQRKL